MNNTYNELVETGRFLTQYGRQMLISLGILVLGLYLSAWAHRALTRLLGKTRIKPPIAATICRVFYLLLLLLTVLGTASHAGVDSRNIVRAIAAVGLLAMAVVILVRPYLPSLPFKKGNTISVGKLFGKVAGITLTHTHIKTFDGKTIFIPNHSVLRDNVVNYHFTPDRKVSIDVNIKYDQDILKTKQLLEEIMISDSRTNRTPRPMTFVKDFLESSIMVSGRCWVKNHKYWQARCDLLEKVKYRFDHEGIKFAFPQLDVHLDDPSSCTQVLGEDRS